MSVHGACRIFFALIERRERKRRRGSDLNLWLVHKDLSSAIQAKRLDYSSIDTVRLETQGDEFLVNRDSGLGGSSSETAHSGLLENAGQIGDAGEFVSSWVAHCFNWNADIGKASTALGTTSLRDEVVLREDVRRRSFGDEHAFTVPVTAVFLNDKVLAVRCLDPLETIDVFKSRFIGTVIHESGVFTIGAFAFSVELDSVVNFRFAFDHFVSSARNRLW